MNIRLTHYTSSIEAIRNILLNGFAYVPNKRQLISDLIPFHDFSKREPQQFGMISFTELLPDRAKEHRGKFGNYGIIICINWAIKHKVQKVLYIDRKGPIFEALKVLFHDAYKKLERRIPYPNDGFWQIAYNNKHFRIEPSWTNLLQLYEYFEPIENSYQQEWRIVHQEPYTGYGENKKEIIKNVSPPKGWANVLNVLRFQVSDIAGFICPEGEQRNLVDKLPDEYKKKQLETFKI